jgi:hypothetical protein
MKSRDGWQGDPVSISPQGVDWNLLVQSMRGHEVLEHQVR